jgi:hypothetical protein
MRRLDAGQIPVISSVRNQTSAGPVALMVRLVLLIAVSQSSPLQAHSWYPPHCCTGQDCKKVDQLEHMPDGSILMHFGGQQVVVPRGFTMQPSKDMDAHVCVFRGASGRWMPRCVFLPTTALLPNQGIAK